MIEALQELAVTRELPYAISIENGTEFTSKALVEWCYQGGVKLEFIRPAKPSKNMLIEWFSGRLRDGRLNVRDFAPFGRC